MEKLNQWLNFLTNIGVLVGLALLAYEIRQNTAALQSQTRATIFSGAQQELYMNMEFPEITYNMGARANTLSDEEKIRLDAWLTASMRAREFAWMEYTDGNLTELEWIGDQEVVRLILGTERTRWWWREVASSAFHPEFVIEVSRLIDNQPEHDYVEKVLSLE